MVTLSTIIPVYNAEDTLAYCLDSILNQSYPNFEVILVDDGSTDNSSELCKVYVEKDLRIKYFRKENGGSASARNFGLSKANGEYISWIDADDWIENDMFEEFLQKFKDTDADIVWSDFYWNKDFEVSSVVCQKLPDDSKFHANQLLIGGIQGMIWNKMFKRSLYVDNNISFADGFNMGEDRNVLFKLLSLANKSVYLNKAFYHYMQTNPKAITRDFDAKRVYEDIGNVKEMVKFINENKFSWLDIKAVEDLKFRCKTKLLFGSNMEDYKNWVSVFPESNYLVSKSNIKLRHKLVAYFAMNNIWFPLKVWSLLKNLKK